MQDPLQNQQEPGPTRALFHERITASLCPALTGKVIAVDGEQDNQGWARQGFQLTGHGKPIGVWQLDIENDQVRVQMDRLLQRFGSVRSLSYNQHSGFIQQQPAQALAHRWNIVDDQDAAGSS